jgi:hypothetical protein
VRVLFRRICLVDGLAYAARDNQAKQLLYLACGDVDKKKKKKKNASLWRVSPSAVEPRRTRNYGRVGPERR